MSRPRVVWVVVVVYVEDRSVNAVFASEKAARAHVERAWPEGEWTPQGHRVPLRAARGSLECVEIEPFEVLG